MSDRRFLILLFLLALALRLHFLGAARELPTQHQLVMDARQYDAMAREIAAGQWLPREVFYQAPFYPYFLAVIYSAGGSWLAVRLLQALIGAGTAVILAVATRRAFGIPAGRLAGILAVLYGPFIFSVPLILKSVLFLFFESLVLLLVLKREGWARPLLAGVCLGICAILQGNTLLLLPLAGLFLLYTHRRLGPAFALGIGAVLAIAPVTILNYRASGDLVLTSYQGGESFFIGNSRGASGTFVPLAPGNQNPAQQKVNSRRLAAALASASSGRTVEPESLTPGEVSSIYWQESFRHIREDPATWGRLLLRKNRLFWNVYEIPDAEGYDVYRREVGGLAFLWIGFGIVAPLGLVGLAMAFRKKWEAGLLFGLLIFGTWISVAMFFVFGRYRLAIVPFLIPLAAHAGVTLVQWFRQKDLRRLALAGAGLAAAALAVNLPAFSRTEVREHDSTSYFNLGTAATRGAEEAYAAFLQEARASGGRLTPRAADFQEQAVRFSSQGERYLEQAIEASPGFFVAQVQRGVLLYRLGIYEASVGRLDRAAPSYASARDQLAEALASGGGRSLPDVEMQARELLGAADSAHAQAIARLGGRATRLRRDRREVPGDRAY